jgi:Arc/MetJ family transcription regulator
MSQTPGTAIVALVQLRGQRQELAADLNASGSERALVSVWPCRISIHGRSRYTGLAERGTAMAKTLIDVDEEQLAAAQKVLRTKTKKETINAALRQVTALAARRRDLQRLISGGLPDLANEEVMRAAWQR